MLVALCCEIAGLKRRLRVGALTCVLAASVGLRGAGRGAVALCCETMRWWESTIIRACSQVPCDVRVWHLCIDSSA